MRVAVTGASGFVGGALCRHLLAEGDELVPFGPDLPEILDIRDREGVMEALFESRPEAVYHLAGVSQVGKSFHNPVETLQVNVEGTLNVLDGCREAGVERVLVVGSAEEYGMTESEGLLSEDLPLKPVSPYGVSKVAAELLGLQAHASSGLGTVMTRSFNHSGPGQAQGFLIPDVAGRIAAAEREGSDTVEIGRTDSVREINDVRDVVRAYRLLMLHGRPGSVYNVCSGVGHRIADVARRLIELSTRRLELRVNPSQVRAVEPLRLVGDPAKLIERTGWTPRYSLDDTLSAVLAEARASTE